MEKRLQIESIRFTRELSYQEIERFLKDTGYSLNTEFVTVEEDCEWFLDSIDHTQTVFENSYILKFSDGTLVILSEDHYKLIFKEK